MGDVIIFPNSPSYVSPYLLKPLRSYKQAKEDRMLKNVSEILLRLGVQSNDPR